MNIKQLVIEEATKLREHATEEERSLLNIEILSPNSPNYCIYGLMTGSCWSERALSLLNICAVPYSERLKLYIDPLESQFSYENDRSFSPIEVFIYNESTDAISRLISYIKGEKETLTVDDL